MTCRRRGTYTQIIPFFPGIDSHPGINADNIKDKEEYEGDGLAHGLLGPDFGPGSANAD